MTPDKFMISVMNAAKSVPSGPANLYEALEMLADHIGRKPSLPDEELSLFVGIGAQLFSQYRFLSYVQSEVDRVEERSDVVH